MADSFAPETRYAFYVVVSDLLLEGHPWGTKKAKTSERCLKNVIPTPSQKQMGLKKLSFSIP